MQKQLKVVVFCICGLPFCYLLLRILTQDLGPDPAQELAKETGEWALRFLIVTLTVSPLRYVTGITTFIRYRRMLGLYALFYASVHFLVWMSFLLGFRWFAIFEEVVERPFITVGFSAFVILVALGVTSPKVMVRKLGKKWKKLHRLVYVAAILAVLHLLWILRADIGEAVLYGALVFLLLGFRLARYLTARSRAIFQS